MYIYIYNYPFICLYIFANVCVYFGVIFIHTHVSIWLIRFVMFKSGCIVSICNWHATLFLCLHQHRCLFVFFLVLEECVLGIVLQVVAFRLASTRLCHSSCSHILVVLYSVSFLPVKMFGVFFHAWQRKAGGKPPTWLPPGDSQSGSHKRSFKEKHANI